jgi:hypothetical protein
MYKCLSVLSVTNLSLANLEQSRMKQFLDILIGIVKKIEKGILDVPKSSVKLEN